MILWAKNVYQIAASTVSVSHISVNFRANFLQWRTQRGLEGGGGVFNFKFPRLKFKKKKFF